MLIGYGRVSTADQTTAPQVDALIAAGCDRIIEETASGADRSRPALARALAMVRRGDVFVVARLDRVARSLSHLLAVVEGLDKRGAGFRSLADAIDTTTPQGRLVLHVLGAMAQFERDLIRERTRAGLAAARARGRVGGNPALKTAEGRAEMAARRAAKRAPVQPAPTPILAVVAGLTHGRTVTLRQIGADLAALGHQPPGGGAWAPATVARLVRRTGQQQPAETRAPAGFRDAAD